MPTQTQLRSAADHYRRSALMAERAVQRVRKASGLGVLAAVLAIRSSQAANAAMAQQAVGLMLTEQEIDAQAEALLNTIEFTTSTENLELMLREVGLEGPSFEQLVTDLVQDAGRAAESVAVTVRPRIGHVRLLNPPSCSRCAVLAGRVYRYSTGFLRHPNDDCVMIPTTLVNDQLVQDPTELMRQGQIRGLSKADQQAILDGADFGQVVNVRARAAGMRESGRVLARRGRLTPEGIYATTNSREEAVQALADAGYLL